MNNRYIQAARAYPPVQTLPDEERKRLRQNFKPLAARRLTALPLIIGELTRDVDAQPGDEWLFASAYGGAISLEQYLESFPTPSPTHFQNSIQPGPLDLINVTRRQSARQLTPLIGGETLFAEALLATLLSPADHVHLVGGEEFGPWSSAHQLGSATTFAYYLSLGRKADNALAELSFTPDEEGEIISPEAATIRLSAREAMVARLPGRGTLRLQWR